VQARASARPLHALAGRPRDLALHLVPPGARCHNRPGASGAATPPTPAVAILLQYQLCHALSPGGTLRSSARCAALPLLDGLPWPARACSVSYTASGRSLPGAPPPRAPGAPGAPVGVHSGTGVVSTRRSWPCPPPPSLQPPWLTPGARTAAAAAPAADVSRSVGDASVAEDPAPPGAARSAAAAPGAGGSPATAARWGADACPSRAAALSMWCPERSSAVPAAARSSAASAPVAA